MDREQLFLLVEIVVFAALSILLLVPYLQYVLAAVLVAYVLTPVYRRLEPRAGPRVSAVALIAVSIFAFALPLAVLVNVVLGQAQTLLAMVRRIVADTAAIGALAGLDVSVEALLGGAGGNNSTLVRSAIGIFGGITDAVVGLTILLFLLYYLLTTGPSLMRWTRRATPLPDPVQDELYARLDRLMWAVLVVNVAIATVQGVLTGIGLWAVGFSSVVFWMVMTTVLSLLPLIGASVVWLPAVAYLAVTDAPVSAVLLFVYGTLVVSLSDNYLRPVLGGREAKLNPGLFILGIFGGVAVFGFMGIFFGPIVIGVLKALVEVYVREYQPGSGA